LQLILPIVAVAVPLLVALRQSARGRWVAIGFFVVNGLLSAVRYTRYAGY
jgi:hypothetical protein